MMKASACMLLTVMVALAVRGGDAMPQSQSECREKFKASMALVNQLMKNISSSVCTAASTEACQARAEGCRTALKPDDFPDTPDSSLLQWMKNEFELLRNYVVSCAEENNYSGIVIGSVLDTPASFKELEERCLTLPSLKEQLNVRDDQQQSMVTCVLTKRGTLDKYARCVNGVTTT